MKIDFSKFDENGKCKINDEMDIFTLSGFYHTYKVTIDECILHFFDEISTFGELCKENNLYYENCIVIVCNYSGDEQIFLYKIDDGTIFDGGCWFDDFDEIYQRNINCLISSICDNFIDWENQFH